MRGALASAGARVRSVLGGPGRRPGPPRPAPSVQSWIPVRAIEDGVIARGDGVSVAALRVLPAAFGLLSESERERRIALVHEALQGLSGRAQLCSLPRPVDLGAYTLDLERRLAAAAGPRRGLLAGYLRYVRALTGAGSGAPALEHRHYVLLAGEPGAPPDGLRLRAAEFAAALGRADLEAVPCGDAELEGLLRSFLEPLHAAEAVPAAAAAPRHDPAMEGSADGT